MRLVRVAVPVPALDGLTYAVPDGMADPLPGARVLVPLGNRVITGCALGPELNHSPDDTPSAPDNGTSQLASVKELLDVLDSTAFLPEDVLRLTSWVAEYYACGAGDAIAAAMPPRAWVESERHAAITELGQARMLLERGTRRELLERLAQGKPLRVDNIAGEKRGAHAALLGVELVDGGKERYDSVAAALARVHSDIEYIAVHDAARPCLAEAWIDAVFAAAVKTGAAILATPINGTIKRAAAGQTIAAAAIPPSRSALPRRT